MSDQEEKQPRWRSIVFGVMFLAMFALGFPFLDKIFAAHVSPGLAFVLTAAAAMVIFTVLGSWFWPQKGSTSPSDSGSKERPGLTALLSLVAIAAALSWSALAYIETNALSQPDHAMGVFTVAVHLKGVVRYMTPEQHTIDEIANWTFFGCVFIPFVTVLATKLRQRLRDDGD